jgi:delta1-piperideine-2-carboxylate reductase
VSLDGQSSCRSPPCISLKVNQWEIQGERRAFVQTTVSTEALTELVVAVFANRGMAEGDARTMAGVVVAAERDGTRSHGIQRIRGYVESMESGWVDPRAAPRIQRSATAMLSADAGNGFAQIALSRAKSDLMSLGRQHGMAVLATKNSHHFAALWPDIEAFAEAGFIALTVLNTRPWMTAWGGTKRVLGTNAMAFACPRAGANPVVWDQASSTMSQGDVLLHATSERPLPPGVGVDAEGQPSTDAAAVLRDGALLPFAGTKGSSIAFMVEILAAAFGGGRFGFEDRSASVLGAVTTNGGQFLLLLDPSTNDNDFATRVESLLATMLAGGSKRLPGDRRYAKRREAETAGITVPSHLLEELSGYARK